MVVKMVDLLVDWTVARKLVVLMAESMVILLVDKMVSKLVDKMAGMTVYD